MSKFWAHIIVILTAPLFLIWGMAILGSEGLLFVGCMGAETAWKVSLIWFAIIFIPPCIYFFIRHPIQKAYRIVIEYWSEWNFKQEQKYR